MEACEFLEILDGAYGISGNEDEVRGEIRNLFEKYCDSVSTDALGSVIGLKKGTDGSAPSVMIEAHMDELGLMVSSITDGGFLKFVTVGGFDPKVLPGTEVTVHGVEKLFGVIGAMPPHLVTDRSKASDIDDLCVDIGLSKAQAEEKVKVGDIISINTSYTKLCGDYAAARCIDDRGGLAAVLRVLDLLKDVKVKNDVYAVATVQEELGLRGARTSAALLQPDFAVAIDVTHGKSSGISEDAFECGKGTVITMGPNLDRKLTQKMIEIAQNNNIAIQKEACAGNTGTDAWEIQVSGRGIRTALLSIPLRYMHANYEVCNLKDIESTAQLIAMLIVGLKGGEDLCF